MKKRAYDRVPADLEISCLDEKNFGTVINISENGMFLKSKNIRFPLDMQFDLSILLKEETLNVPVKVNRVTKSNGYYDGIGLELMKRPRNYLRFINRLRYTLQDRKISDNGDSED